jgi:hypothetical protein
VALELVLARTRALKQTIQLEQAAHLARMQENRYCAVCIGAIVDPAGKTLCGHEFCYGCLRVWLERNSTCPNCRARVRKI